MSVSIHKRESRKPYEVRWAEPSGRQRSRSFTRRRDADRFDERVKQLKESGRLAELDSERITLAEFGERWWQHARRDLEKASRISYGRLWNTHILPRLGDKTLAELTPLAIEEYRATLTAAEVGAPTIRKAMAVLQAALSRAVLWGYLPSNPVAAVRKPAAKPQPREPIPPARVEAMRRHLLTDGLHADAALICTLAYAGLRPEEALALTWGDVGERTLRVTKAVSFGEGKATKTEHSRAVNLLAPLADDLAALRTRRHHPAARRLVWPKGYAGDGLWQDHDYRNWRKRVYRPAADVAGLADRRPYTLRASFASLLIAEGQPITYVADQCGHSVETCARHYALLFAEFAGQHIDAAQTIRAARDGGSDLRDDFADATSAGGLRDAVQVA